MQGLKDRVAWVTGSSRGIGAQIAKALAERGARVAVHGRDASALATIHSEIEAAGGRVVSVLGDVTKFADSFEVTTSWHRPCVRVSHENQRSRFAVMFDPTADFGHKVMRAAGTLTGNFPRQA
jgi:NAD(P)-dependent dehydrogenase (short-subunit alcohol dehydrogenase family)